VTIGPNFSLLSRFQVTGSLKNLNRIEIKVCAMIKSIDLGSRKDSFLTVDEAAQLSGLSHWTIRLWLHNRRLTKYKSGSRTAVNRTELLELLKPTKSRDENDSACNIQQQKSSVNPHLIGDVKRVSSNVTATC